MLLKSHKVGERLSFATNESSDEVRYGVVITICNDRHVEKLDNND